MGSKLNYLVRGLILFVGAAPGARWQILFVGMSSERFIAQVLIRNLTRSRIGSSKKHLCVRMWIRKRRKEREIETVDECARTLVRREIEKTKERDREKCTRLIARTCLKRAKKLGGENVLCVFACAYAQNTHSSEQVAKLIHVWTKEFNTNTSSNYSTCSLKLGFSDIEWCMCTHVQGVYSWIHLHACTKKGITTPHQLFISPHHHRWTFNTNTIKYTSILPDLYLEKKWAWSVLPLSHSCGPTCFQWFAAKIYSTH